MDCEHTPFPDLAQLIPFFYGHFLLSCSSNRVFETAFCPTRPSRPRPDPTALLILAKRVLMTSSPSTAVITSTAVRPGVDLWCRGGPRLL